MRRSITIIILSLAATFGVAPVQAAVTYDATYLTSLFQAQLKKEKPDPYVEKLITQERARMRKLADQEVLTLVAGSEKSDDGQAGSLSKSLDLQHALIGRLQEEIRDRRVDLDLLSGEEDLYLNPENGATVDEGLRLTATHQELLAKKAVLEERIAAFNAGLSLQQDRLSKLNAQQRFEQFGALINSLYYVLIIVGAVIIDRLIRRRLIHKIGQKSKRYFLSKLASISIYVIAILWILSKLFAEHPGAVASLAIIGAGLAVAMQDIVKDVVAWFIIIQRRLYKLGNRITIGSHTGDIIDIGLLRTTMLEVSTGGIFNAHERSGKTLYFPNSLLLREPVMNYNTTSDFMNVEMKVTVTYESDWRKAEELIRIILHKETLPFVEHARHQEDRRTALFFGSNDPGEPGVHIDIAGDGILFTLSFVVPIGKRRSVVTQISRDILEQFALAGIGIAYSTVRVIGGNVQL
ncbi:MAG: mechanosensitive ion channel [Candidatus Peribacteraceae bacterium]|nr:mechanosensitive ion channel [Candidatus Peribacteraceae bacterium]